MKKLAFAVLFTAFSAVFFAQNSTVTINGVQWATCNIGEKGNFVSSSEQYGNYYTFDEAKAVMPSIYWRLPTEGEMNALLDETKVKNEWTTQNGVAGRKFTDKNTGASIFLPAAGVREGNSIKHSGSSGLYWSKTLDNNNYINFLAFGSGKAETASVSSGNVNFVVRPIYNGNAGKLSVQAQQNTTQATAQTMKSAGTLYYKQIKVVTNGKEQTGNNTGQFITFNSKGCYDSDKSGYTVNNGFLEYKKENDGKVYYLGSSYWGDATYVFTENYSRLNIRVGDVTYVYILTTPPANITTCALIKAKQQVTDGGGGVVVVNPVDPYKTNKTPTAKQKYVTREESCPQCYNSGKCSTCNGKSYVISTYTQNYTPCVNCTNGKCTKCGGTGKVLKGKYETVYE